MDEPLDPDRLIKEATAAEKRIHISQIYAFYAAVIDPQEMFERITESVEPLIRSLRVRTAYAFQNPRGSTGRVIALPILLQKRGALIEALQVHDSSGARVSTLSVEMTVALELAIIRCLLRFVGPEAFKDYVDNVESCMACYLSSSREWESTEVKAIILSMSSLPRTDSSEPLLLAINRLLKRLSVLYPVMVLTECKSQPTGSFTSEQHRFLIERRVLPSHLPNIDRGMAAWLRRIRDGIRREMGIRPAMVSFPLLNADRCSSYHLQIRGPKGTYLARQDITETPSPTKRITDRSRTVPPVELDGSHVARGRYGQRIAHLYIRRGVLCRRKSLECHFFERMPGSLGMATMSALAAAVLVSIGALTHLGFGHIESTDLVAALLAFPAVAGTWLGFERSHELFGGVLMVRISSIVTIVTALSASAYYTLGPINSHPSTLAIVDRNGVVVWGLIVGTALGNTLACIGGWFLRASVENHFVKKPIPEMEDVGA